jgi:dUTP pyrophosphatase
MYLRFAKTRNVKSPKRNNPTDAGIDFFIPEFDEAFKYAFRENPANKGTIIDGDNRIIIRPGANACIPSGIKIEVPYGYMALFLNKSGIASKKDLLIGAQVIDTAYAGEVGLDLHNVSQEHTQDLLPGDKVVQLVMIPIACCGLMEIKVEELYKDFELKEIRGEKGFGSSDKK